MRFWDSSALVPLLIQEPATPVARALLESDPQVIVWWGAQLELQSALARSFREDRILGADYESSRRNLVIFIESAYEILPSERVRSRAGLLLDRHPLRAADALQLAAAQTWCLDRPSGAGFVCLDNRLRTAARGEGFVVQPPAL